MADAPAGGGGSGWGALEVILAIILAFGLIATLTGNPVSSVTGPSKKATTSSKTVSKTDSATAGTTCGIILSHPTSKEKVDSAVTIKGIIAQCINITTLPDTLTAYVIDSKNTVLSDYTTITVNKNIFGDATFSTIIPLQGVARSTTAYVVITSPTKSLNARTEIQLITGTNIQFQQQQPYTAPATYPGNNTF